MHYNHVMNDIETLGVESNAIILSLGAVAFNLEEQDAFDDITSDRCFYARLDLDEQVAKGRSVSPSTVAWWINQNKDAKKVFNEVGFEVARAIGDYHQFRADTGAVISWGNGNMFDTVLLRSLWKDFGAEWPFMFRNDMDLRTLRLAAGEPAYPKIAMVEHNALDDAKYQVICAQMYHQIITPIDLAK